MRSPAQVYLKYLLSHPDKYNNALIKKRCHKKSVYYGSDDYLDELREGLFLPKIFRPKDRRHKPSMDFIMAEGIYGLWFRTSAVASAVSVLRKPRVRETIESLLTLHAPYDAISYALSTKHNASVSAAAIDMYYHLFWNASLLSTTEMRQVCRKVEKIDVPYGGYHILRTSPRVLAAELPSTPISSALVLLRLGFVPAKIDVFKMLPELAEVLTLKAYETALLGGKDAAAEVFQLMRTVEIAFELKSKMTPPEEELSKMMKNVTLATKRVQTPTIPQLSQGNFSTGNFEEKKAEEGKKKK